MCRTQLPAGREVYYVLTFPETGRVAPGQTIAIPRTLLFGCNTLLCSTCVCLPQEYEGSTFTEPYRAFGQAGEKVGFDLQRSPASIPVRATFRPLSPFDTSSNTATALNVPLSPILADSITTGFINVNFPRGPGRSEEAFAFRVTLPNGRYQRSLEPLPPFDEYFPPVVSDVGGESDLNGELGVTLEGSGDTPKIDQWGTAGGFTLTSAEPMTGWILYFRDRATGRRVSNIFRPKTGVINEVHLFTVNRPGIGVDTVTDVVLEPPPDKPEKPLLIDEVIIQPGAYEMPRLPPAEPVSGVVTGSVPGVEPEKRPFVSGRLLVRSVREEGKSGLEPDLGTDNKLRYSTELPIDASGAFTGTLPPGRYTVTVIPHPDTAFAATSVTTQLTVTPGAPNFGKSFAALPLVPVQGVVTLIATGPAGGAVFKAFGGATVRAQPSANQGAAFRTYPRARSTKTGADGAFSLALDPGKYDIFVEPAAESRWPTTIYAALDVPAAVEGKAVEPVSLPSERLRLGAPVDLSFRLVERVAQTEPVPGVFVRAYVISNQVPIEVARGRTDLEGSVDLLTTLPP